VDYKSSEVQAVLSEGGKKSVSIKTRELGWKFKATNILYISKETNQKLLKNMDAEGSHMFVLGNGDKSL